MLPGKPASLTQRIRLDGLELVMTMAGAKVDEFSFTVACAVLPDELPATQARVLSAMRGGMLGNIAGTPDKVDDIKVSLIDPAGVARGERAAVRLAARGSVQGRAVQMHGIFVAEGRRACQAVALGEGLPPDEARTFVDSLRLIVAGA